MTRDAGVTATGAATDQEEDRSLPVVVGVDDSGSARHAAEWAMELTSAWRAPLHLVHAETTTTEDRARGPALAARAGRRRRAGGCRRDREPDGGGVGRS